MQEGELFGLINLLNFTGTTNKVKKLTAPCTVHPSATQLIVSLLRIASCHTHTGPIALVGAHPSRVPHAYLFHLHFCGCQVLSAGDAKRQQAGAGSSGADADDEAPPNNAASSCVAFDIQPFEAVVASEDGQEGADEPTAAHPVDVLVDTDGDRPLSEVLVTGSLLEGARGGRQPTSAASAAGGMLERRAAGGKRKRAGQQHAGGRAEADAALGDFTGTDIIRWGCLCPWVGRKDSRRCLRH